MAGRAGANIGKRAGALLEGQVALRAAHCGRLGRNDALAGSGPAGCSAGLQRHGGHSGRRIGSEQGGFSGLSNCANPIASLISVPFQFNYDRGLNTLSTGQRSNLNIQPVIPISLTPDWNVISRTILPINWTENAGVGTGQILGLATSSKACSSHRPKPGME